MQRTLRLAWFLALLARSPAAHAQEAPCPRGPEPWVAVIFAGPGWSDRLREGVLRELGTELARRSFAVCQQLQNDPDVPPQKVVTLLAPDSERVSIVASNIEQEGGFTGRTIMVGAIPEDARALAIAQAVDEALRSESGETEQPLAAPVSAPVAPPTVREAPRPSWFIAAAVAPALQIAAAGSGRTETLVAPGVALRLLLGRAKLGGSLGVAVTRASDLSFGSIAIRDLRIPVDASFSLRFSRGAAQAACDIGLLAALVSYEHRPTDAGRSTLELGGRVGLRLGWGQRVVPWVGASVEVLPSSTDLRFSPTGSVGQAPSVWLGFALGTEVRWP